MHTLPPATSGEESMRAPVVNVHAGFPLAASSACTTLSRPPSTTSPPSTAADE
jgi:hypothetical protein